MNDIATYCQETLAYKLKPENIIIADFLNKIRAEQDKQAELINKLEVTHMAYEINYNKELEQLAEKIGQLEKQVTILKNYISPL